MRIVTRPDFDGVVCAVLLYEALSIAAPVKWAEPGDMQKGKVDIRPGDVIANLPYHPDCELWFDHHFSSRVGTEFRGAYEIAPSAAGVVYRYFGDRLAGRYEELVRQADKIDAAELSLEEVLQPENHPYVLLSMTISGRQPGDEAYWNLLVERLRREGVDDLLQHPEVQPRAQRVVAQNREYAGFLDRYTCLDGCVSVTDFRSLTKSPDGNRFLVYSLVPEAVVNVKIFYDDSNPERVVLKAGHSIFNRNCNVNLGALLAGYGGGGHRGAASCRFPRSREEEYVPAILDVLHRNQEIDVLSISME